MPCESPLKMKKKKSFLFQALLLKALFILEIFTFCLTLFPEMQAITSACTGTHTSKITSAIYHMHEVHSILTFYFVIIVYFS